MSIPLFTLKEMPENCFVVRIKKTGQYIHYNNDNDDVFIKQKMCGCLVLRNKEDAEKLEAELVNEEYVKKVNDADSNIKGI
jgi:hypothetical protein